MVTGTKPKTDVESETACTTTQWYVRSRNEVRATPGASAESLGITPQNPAKSVATATAVPSQNV